MLPEADVFMDLTEGCDVCQSMKAAEIKHTQLALPCRCGMSAWYHNATHPHSSMMDSNCEAWMLAPEAIVKDLSQVMARLETP